MESVSLSSSDMLEGVCFGDRRSHIKEQHGTYTLRNIDLVINYPVFMSLVRLIGRYEIHLYVNISTNLVSGDFPLAHLIICNLANRVRT